MERDGLGFDFALFDVYLVAAENDGDLFADADEVAYSSMLVSLLFLSKPHKRVYVRCQLGTFL